MTDRLLSTDTIEWSEPIPGVVQANIGRQFKVFPSKAAAEVALITDWGTVVTEIQTLGYAEPGDGGGARYKYVAADPGHAGSLNLGGAGTQFAVITNLCLLYAQFGSKGDGATADDAPIAACHVAARALNKNVWVQNMHGILAPIVVGENEHDLRILGARGFSERADGVCGFRKLPGFTGDAAIMVGTDVSTVRNLAFEMSGVEIDGNDQVGDGVQLFRTGDARMQNVYSHDNTTGWGFRFDGNWFGRFEHCISRRNGKTSTNQGGGFRLSHATDESSDSTMHECYVNQVGNIALEMDPRSDLDINHRQTDWRFTGGEYQTGKFGGGYDGEISSNWVARLNGDRCVFVGVKFVSGRIITGTPGAEDLQADAENNIIIGTAGAVYSTHKMVFMGCTFQYSGPTRLNYPTLPPGYGVVFGGVVDEIDFISPIVEGISLFIDANSADASSGPIRYVMGESDTTKCRDLNRIMQNLHGGAVGFRPGGGQDQWYLECLVNSIPINIVARNAAGTTRVAKFDPVNERLDLGPYMLKLPVLTAAPASQPPAGTEVYADRATWDPLAKGSGPLYKVVSDGAAWVAP